MRKAMGSGDPSRSLPAFCFILIASASLNTAHALEWAADVGAGLAHSSNVNRVPEGDSASLATAEGNLQLVEVRRTLVLDAEAAFIHREYFDNEHESDTFPDSRASVAWAPVPDRFAWTLTNYLGQVALAPADSLLPQDRQIANVLTTGPALFLPLMSDWSLDLSAQYGDVYYEDSDLDNERVFGSVGLEYALSQNDSFYVNSVGSRRDYDQDAYEDFEIYGVHLGYTGLGRRTTLAVEVGGEELASIDDENAPKQRGEYVNIGIERQLSSSTRASLRAVSRFGDSADIFALDQMMEASLGDTSNVQLSSEPIRQRFVNLLLDWRGSRTSAGLGLIWTTESVESTVLPDREIYGSMVDLNRRLSSQTSLGFSAYYLRELRTGVEDEKQDDLAATFSVDWRATEHVAIRAQLEQYGRRNSLSDYDETRALVTIRYVLRPMRADMPSFASRELSRHRRMGSEETDESAPRARPAPPIP